MKNIRTEHLSKSFDNDIALKDINLSLEKGKIYGLIGRNGAGKSTLLRIISNRIFPTSGKVYYDDVEISKVKDLACVYLDEAQSQTMEGEKIINLFKMTSGFYPEFSLENALLDAGDFGIDTNNRFSKLSMGSKAIVKSIIALNTHADFILLDEPTLGYDVVSRDILYKKILREYENYGNTILLSTHLINEISPIVEETIFIKNGSLLFMENTENLLSKYCILKGQKTLVRNFIGQGNIIKEESYGELTKILLEANISEISKKCPHSISLIRPNLQELFIGLSI